MGLCLGWDRTGLVYALPTTVNSDVQLSWWGSCYKLVQQVLKKKEGETTKRTVVSIPLSQKWFVITSFTLLGSTSFSKLFLEIEFASVVSPKRRLLPSVKVQGERQAVNLRAGPSCTLLGQYQLFPILEQNSSRLPLHHRAEGCGLRWNRPAGWTTLCGSQARGSPQFTSRQWICFALNLDSFFQMSQLIRLGMSVKLS